MPEFLFAYGTLKPGVAPKELGPILARLALIGYGRVPGRLFDLGSYPAMVADDQEQAMVTGTVLRLPPEDDILTWLDAYEGAAFHRIRCAVELLSGERLWCWAYCLPSDPSDAPRIETGIWPARRQNL